MKRSCISILKTIVLIAVSICVSGRIPVQATQSPQSIKIGEIEFFGVGSGEGQRAKGKEKSSNRIEQRGKSEGQRAKGKEQSSNRIEQRGKSRAQRGKRKRQSDKGIGQRAKSKGQIHFTSEELAQLRQALPVKEGDEFRFDSGSATVAQIKQVVRQTTGRDATDVNFVCCDDRGAAMIFIGLPGPAYRPFKYNPVLKLRTDPAKLRNDKTDPPAKLRTLTQPRAVLPHPSPLPRGEGETPKGEEKQAGGSDKGEGAIHDRDNPQLPDEIVALVEQAGELAHEAAQKEAREDRSQGYALSLYPPLREVQLKIREYALDHAGLLHRVLYMSMDAKQRRAAVYALGYTKQSDAQLASLVWASRDPSGAVRNDATRALAVLAESDPRAAGRISTAHFVAMLSSGSWSDRNKAAMLLSVLTARRNPTLLGALRRNALGALIEMARWRNAGHAYHARMILGRTAGIEESLLEKLVKQGQVDEIIRELGRPRTEGSRNEVSSSEFRVSS